MGRSKNSAENEEHVASDHRHITKAPLHLAYKSTTCIPKQHLDRLKQTFQINRGPWTRRERRRLKKNWNFIVTRYSEFSDPKFAFGSGHDQNNTLNLEEVRQLKRKYKQFQVMPRMAYKLDDRLMCDIYARCRTTFFHASYHFKSRVSVPDSLESELISGLNGNVAEKNLCDAFNVSPKVIDSIKRRPKRAKRYSWNHEADCTMEQIVEMAAESKSSNSHGIDWAWVANEMRSMNYNVDRDQCYRRWKRLRD